jgi:DNA polymerase-3 subunit gamma/tau
MEKVELYRKYRPENLDDMVGNEKTIKSLEKELENGSHVFLMTGPAGCGKTTLARIMAKKVNAGPLSIHEINSAENRGIDTAREIMEQMRFNPSDGESIVWILDEMHMITSAGQNALLKALEDTPEHCYFFLCTTNPEKLIAPLKTRCSIINVSPLKDEEMIYLLKRTARAEKIKVGSEVYERICEIAQGGSRKGLKLLAKVIYLDSDEERLEVLKNDDSSENQEVRELCKLLMSGKANWSSIAKVLKSIDMTEAERVRQAVMGYMGAVLLNGKASTSVISAMQAFSSADTYKNGKNAIVVACLDYLDLLGSDD